MRAPRFLRRLWRWMRRSGRSAIVRLERATGAPGDLRQFVYLDEIALRSLMAARYGAEEVRIIETASKGREAEFAADISQNIPAVSSANASARFQRSSSKSSEVERQTTVQSIFKEFLNRETGHLRWDSETEGQPESIARGDLIQVRVRLAPDPIYQVSAIITLFADLSEGLPESQQIDIGAISTVLERLMVGQIPLRSEVVAKKPPAHKEVDETALPLFLVATTEIDQYWTDTRRVLFGEQEFLALVRVTVSGPTRLWSPIKALDMVRKIPGMREQIDQLDSLESLLSGGGTPRAGEPYTALADSLVAYALAIGVPRNNPLLPVALAQIANGLGEKLPSYLAANEALDRIDEWWKRTGGKVPSGDMATARRVSALARINSSSASVSTSTFMRDEAHYLEGEIVAIYW